MTEPERVLEQFYAECGLSTDFYQSIRSNDVSSSVSPTARQALIDGLYFLEQATLLSARPLPCPALFLHGRSDTIVPFQAGKRFCDMAGGRFADFEGPHAFFIDRATEVTTRILEFAIAP